MRGPVIVVGGIVLVAAGAAVGTAARPPMKPMPPDCVARTDAEARPTRVATLSAGMIAFCLEGSAETSCWTVDLATGRYARGPELAPFVDAGDAGPPSDGEDPPPTPEAKGALTVARTPRNVKVCKTGTSDCRTYAPKGLPKGGGPLRASVNEAGTLMVVEIPGVSSTVAFAETYDLVTGKRIARFKVAKPDGPCGGAELLGDTVMLTTSVCEGPGESSWLATPAGKKIAMVGGKDSISTAETTPVRVDGDVWAFDAGNGGAEVVLQNVRTGAVTKRIALPTDADRGGPATALASDGAGGLVVVTGDPHDGDVLVLDVAAGTVKKTYSPPLCR